MNGDACVQAIESPTRLLKISHQCRMLSSSYGRVYSFQVHIIPSSRWPAWQNSNYQKEKAKGPHEVTRSQSPTFKFPFISIKLFNSMPLPLFSSHNQLPSGLRSKFHPHQTNSFLFVGNFAIVGWRLFCKAKRRPSSIIDVEIRCPCDVNNCSLSVKFEICGWIGERLIPPLSNRHCIIPRWSCSSGIRIDSPV